MAVRAFSFFLAAAAFVPVFAFGETVQCVNSYSGQQVKTYSLPAGTLNPGLNQHNALATNAAAAQQDIGKTFFTTELTSFNDQQCTDGPCRNNIPGIAHRTWPLNSCVAVCSAHNRRCVIAIVMDKGPNTQLRCRTIDANPALQQELDMRGGTIQASYQLLSIPPALCTPGSMGGAPALQAGQTTIRTSNVGTSNIGGNQFGGLYSASSAYPSLGAYAGYSPISIPQTAVSQGAPRPTVSGVPSSAGEAVQTGAVQGSGYAAIQIMARPTVIRPGRTALLSWTSVGMRPGSCTVRLQGVSETIASAPEGSQQFIVPADAPQGTITFELVCMTVSGEVVASEAEVTIQ